MEYILLKTKQLPQEDKDALAKEWKNVCYMLKRVRVSRGAFDEYTEFLSRYDTKHGIIHHPDDYVSRNALFRAVRNDIQYAERARKFIHNYRADSIYRNKIIVQSFVNYCNILLEKEYNNATKYALSLSKNKEKNKGNALLHEMLCLKTEKALLCAVSFQPYFADTIYVDTEDKEQKHLLSLTEYFKTTPIKHIIQKLEERVEEDKRNSLFWDINEPRAVDLLHVLKSVKMSGVYGRVLYISV